VVAKFQLHTFSYHT